MVATFTLVAEPVVVNIEPGDASEQLRGFSKQDSLTCRQLARAPNVPMRKMTPSGSPDAIKTAISSFWSVFMAKVLDSFRASGTLVASTSGVTCPAHPLFSFNHESKS